jgi:hypothetical protein
LFEHVRTLKHRGCGAVVVALVGLIAPEALAQTKPNDAPAGTDATASVGVGADASGVTASGDVAGQTAAETPTKVAPPEGEPLPVYVPPNSNPAPAQTKPEEKEEGAASAPSEDGDTILYSGYLPGYRTTMRLGEAPNTPRVGTLPGGMSGNFNAPMPPSEWVFSYGGSLTAALKVSMDQRKQPNSQQATTVFHVAPETVEVYNSFLATRAVPDNWASARFEYGNARVKATISIDTWNPTQPTTFYQLGSQYFINNAFMTYNVGQVAGATVTVDAGYMTTLIGEFSSYTNRMYTNPLIAGLRGAGMRTTATYPITPKFKLYGQHQLLLDRQGTNDKQTIPNPENGYERPYWAHPIINSVVAGFNWDSTPRLELRLAYVNAFATDNRLKQNYDDVNTRGQDEVAMADPRLDVVGGWAQVFFETWGVLGLAGSRIMAQDAYSIRSVNTYASFGEELTDRWLGVESFGTGSVTMAALNYELSIGRVVSYPAKFEGHGPDIFIKTGVHVAKSSTEVELFNNRWRYKGGIDVLYTFSRHVGIGARFDQVSPNSKDTRENFQVISPRIQFKTDWTSRDTFNLMYAKWLYGSMTRIEGTGERTPAQIDDEFFGFSANMWW